MPPYACICAGNRPPWGGFGSDDSLTVIDLANPLAPTFAGNAQGAGAPDWLQSPTNVAIKDNYAYVCAYADDRLTVVDITDPTTPTVVASLNVPGIYDIKISGDYAFVVTEWANQFISIDISNPLAPAIDDTVLHGWGNPESIYIQDNTAYIGAADGTLHIFDISNPSAIAFLGEGVVAVGDACFVIVDGNYAYISDFNDLFVVVDVTNPAAIAVTGSIGGAGAPNHMDSPVGLYKVGNLVYVCAFGEWYFNIVNVANPAVPAIAGQLDIMAAMGVGTPRPREVIVQGNYAYVTEGDNAPPPGVWDGLLAIDISNPAAPFIAGSIFGGGAPNFLAHAYGLILYNPIVVPTVTTDPATSVINNAATVNGTLDDDGGEACDCGFEWGETVAYGNTTPTQSRTTGQTFAQTIYPLKPNTTYYFRAFATNSSGTSYGAQRSFTTPQVPYYSSLISPSVQTNPATLITEHTARLNGEVVEDGGVMGAVRFQWGLTTEYGNNTPWEQGYGKGDEFLINLSNLAEGQGFHFRAQFRVGGNVVSGADASFNTLSPLGPVTLIPDELIYLLETV